MTLVYDRTAELGTTPGLHVLLAGVSLYPYLPGGGRPGRTADGYGLEQLASPALTAYRLFELLERRKDKLGWPLATVRMLLSPSDIEKQVEPKLANAAGPCTYAALATAIMEWRSQAWADPNSAVLFYFGGHGVQKTTDDFILLTEDFNAPNTPGGMLAGTVSWKHVQDLMAPGAGGAPSKRVARRQFYFADSCRSTLGLLRKLQDGDRPPVIDQIELHDLDDRIAPVYAGLPGKQNFSVDGEPTLFGRALIDCLGEYAGEPLDGSSGVEWCVTTLSLIRCLKEHLTRSNAKYQTDQGCIMTGPNDRVVLHRLDKPPDADVDLLVEPDAAMGVVQWDVQDPLSLRSACAIPNPLVANPYRTRLPCGSYRVSVTATSPYVGPPPSMRVVEWPGKTWPAKVGP